MTNRHAYTLSGALGALAGLVTVLAVFFASGRNAVGDMMPPPEDATSLPMVEQTPELIDPEEISEAEDAESRVHVGVPFGGRGNRRRRRAAECSNGRRRPSGPRCP